MAKKEGTFIVCYNTKTKKRRVILTDFGKDKIFPFTKDTVISSILKYENMLLFHDRNKTAPFKVNLNKVSENDIYYKTSEDAMVVKAQPDMPEVKMGFDSKYAAPTFNNNVFWFACRYKYEDGEVSAISPYSRPQLTVSETPDFDVNEIAFSNLTDIGNGVQLGTYSVLDKKQENISTINFEVGQSDVCTSISQAFSNRKIYATTKYGVFSYDVEKKIIRKLVSISDLEVETFIWVGVNSNDTIQILAASKGENLIIYKYKSNHWEMVGMFASSTGFTEFVSGRVVMSSFGNNIYVAGSYEIYRSKNGGDNGTWEKIFNIRSFYDTSSKINDICCNADGRIVYVTCDALVTGGTKNYTIIYRSMDYGETFDQVYLNLGGQDSMACSGDGRIVCSGNKISFDYGDTWDSRPLGIANGGGKGLCTMSYSGKYIVTAHNNWNDYTKNYIYLSRDYGKTREIIYSYNDSSLKLREFMVTFPSHPSPDSLLYFIYDKSNYADIVFNTGTKHVTDVEILMKKGTTMYVIATINKKKEGLKNGIISTYRFLNTELYKVVSTKDVVKLFDNVPLSAATSTIIQNSLMFGNYIEGFDTDQLSGNISVSILKDEFKDGDISLKSGTKQRYGIVYYDHFGRCTPVLNPVDIYIDHIRSEIGKEKRMALVKVEGLAPEWAVKYKIARGTPNISFDMVSGFNNVYAADNKIYLEITGYPWITPKPGDFIELLSEAGLDSGVGNIVIPVFDFYDNSGNTSMTITLSDGSHTTSSKTESPSPVPPGRYVIVDSVSFKGYSYQDVIIDKSKYLSSNFYIVYENSTIGDVLFNEIPYEFEIKNKLHKGNQKDQDSASDYAECLLEYDGDAILMKNPTRELNRYPNQTVFTTLGRTVGKVENYRRIHRFAGLCVSEPYVDDTKYNGLSSFNNALVNYKDLEKNHREIELIDGYDTNIEVYQRDKVSNVQYRKNILTTASGDKQVTQSSDIFGEQQMYAPDYGMDNFRSYAKSGNARYFVDSDRGAVLRKDLNGIIPVSNFGMSSFLFKELTNNGSVAGFFDARHDSYVLCLRDYAINFLEAANGWSSFFEFIPDAIVNTNSGVFSFKKGILYKHDSLEGLSIYDEEKALVVKFICNDYRDVIKVFNAIMLESSVMPFRVIFNTDAGQSVIDSGYFRKEEGVFLSHIPMCANKAEYVLAGICPENYKGNEIPLINHNFSMVHMGDEVHIMGYPDDTEEYKGKIIGISDSKIVLDKRVDISAGSYILCHDSSQVNGEMSRGKYMEVEMFFRSAGRILLKSIQIDIDESKV